MGGKSRDRGKGRWEKGDRHQSLGKRGQAPVFNLNRGFCVNWAKAQRTLFGAGCFVNLDLNLNLILLKERKGDGYRVFPKQGPALVTVRFT